MKAALKKKVNALLLAREEGKKRYEEADTLLGELIGEMPVGEVFDLGNGLRATLVDNFADGKNTAFRPCGVKRFDLKFK